MHRLRSPREESSSSSHRRPFSATSSPSTARSKYSFPVVNTPVLRRARHNSENQPPENALNIKANAHPYSEANSPAPHLMKSASSKGKLNHHGSMSLPPRPPPPRPSPSVNSSSARNGQDHAQGNVKRKLNLEIPSVSAESNVTCVLSSSDQDSGVKVIVRVRPCNNKEKLEEATEIVEKISENSLCISDQQFTFDHVATVESSQQSMFELVGQPLVENCLQGFNSSIFAYGQTGSGKTYTMWGSTQDLLAQSPCNERGLTPRVFERLFERINEEEQKNTDKQLHYQCRCSFLEIYNEQITDLLEPLQKNLQVREDTKAGVYVENLREEFVANVHDVFRLMLKGLSNRRVASTSMNLESSRSHTLFMCVIESRCKSMADGVSSIRTSRMNLVDLAGSERQKLTGAAGERLKEAGNINRSLSQLGNLINILAEVSQTGRPRHIPYRDSRLTFLMQESLGGNAKLAMICAISPASSCKSETLSTLRFAQRAKSIQNKAVINEETENDVKLLREQIRQLKTELMRMKTNESPSEAAGSYSTSWNARRSYNLLRMSLSRPLTLPHCDTDTDEEMEIDEDAVEHIDAPEHMPISSVNGSLSKEDLQVLSPILSVSSISNSSISSPKGLQVLSPVLSVSSIPDLTPSPLKDGLEMSALSSISLVKERLEAPILSLSPRLQQDTRKSFGVASILQESSDICQHEDTHSLEDPNCSLNHNDTKECSLENEILSVVEEEPSCCLDSPQGASELNQTLRESLTFIRSSLQFSKKLSCNTDTLAESLNHGLQIIQNNKKKTSSRTHASMAQFSFQKSMWDKKITSKSLQISAQNKVTMSLKGRGRLGLVNEMGSPQMMTESQLDQTITFSSPEMSSSPALPKVSRSQLLTEEDTCQIDSEFLSHQPFYKKPEISPVSSHQELEMKVPEFMDYKLHSVEAVTVAVQTSPICFPENPRMFNPVSEHMVEPVVNNVEEAAIQTSLLWSSQEIKLSTNQDQNTQTILEAALRREGAMEETLNRKIAEIEQLNNLLIQYKQERECNAALQQSSEEKIARLEKLMDGTIPEDVFLSEEWSSLINERKILQEKYDNHPEVTLANIKQQRLTEELEQYKSFCDQGERESLMSEISQLRNLLQSYVLDTSRSVKQSRTIQSRSIAGGYSNEGSPLYEDTRNSTEKCSSVVVSKGPCKSCEESKQQWMEREEEWMSLIEELRSEVQEYKQQTKRRKHELEGQQRCADELKETLQIAMEGHARLLDQYAELQEKHISLLAKHRKVRDAMSEAKKKAGKMQGFLGSKWFEAQAAELSAMKLEHEEEKRAAQEQIENLQSQVRDTADAVQAAGELLVRLKEAEEAALIAQDAAALAADDVEKLYREMDKLKRRHKTEIATMHQRLLEARFQKSKLCPMCVMAERVKFEFSGAEEEEEALARSIAEDHLNNPGEEEGNYCDDEDDDDHSDLYGEHLCAV